MLTSFWFRNARLFIAALIIFVPELRGSDCFSSASLFKLPELKISKKERKSVNRGILGQSSDALPPLRLDSQTDQGSLTIDYETCRRSGQSSFGGEAWSWQLFPNGIIYPNYLAGVNESRLGGVWNKDKDVDWIWDITLGGRAPILRYGNRSTLHPEGWQLDIEGSVHLRLDMEHERDMDANDFRFGIPLSYGNRVWQFKTGYYHVSSHLGDERMMRLDDLGIDPNRLNYVREALFLGFSYRLRPALRVYAEADYAFWAGERTKPWHFQFGAEYSAPYQPANGFRGSPFAAMNVLLLQEHDFDGSICVQAGWQWRGSRNEIFRIGVQYFGGVSEQYEHIGKREHKIGLGLWYDF